MHLEGGAEFKKGKKPEAMIKKILDFCTFAGDLIMDFHVGSGTTGAVAHKMNRQCNISALNRLNYVRRPTSIERLKERDLLAIRFGISKSVNWQGGGDFIYCELMEYNEAYHQSKSGLRNQARHSIDIWRDMSRRIFPELGRQTRNVSGSGRPFHRY